MTSKKKNENIYENYCKNDEGQKGSSLVYLSYDNKMIFLIF